MLTVCRDDLLYTVIITILREVGLRIGCITHLMYFMVFEEYQVPREVCWVPEKRGTFREFIPSPGLRQALVQYVQSLDIPRDLSLIHISEPTRPR